MYQWSDYGPDPEFTQVIATQSEPDQLSSLRQYLETNSDIRYDGALSMPFYLGLTTKENVEWLRGYVSETYSNLFEEAQELYKSELARDKLFKAAKRKAEEISNEFQAQVSELSNKNLIEKGLVLHSEGWKVSPQISQAMALQLKLSQSNCQNIAKRLRRSQKKVEELQEQLRENSDCSDDSGDSDNDDSDA